MQELPHTDPDSDFRFSVVELRGLCSSDQELDYSRNQIFFLDFGTPEKKPDKTPESPNTTLFFAALRAAFSIIL